jgi:hypothetical protein
MEDGYKSQSGVRCPMIKALWYPDPVIQALLYLNQSLKLRKVYCYDTATLLTSTYVSKWTLRLRCVEIKNH